LIWPIYGVEGEIENDTVFVSWKYGLERILLGYAINDDSLYESPNSKYAVKPLDIVEGEYAKEGLKLKLFVDTLIEFIYLRSKPRKLKEWQEYVFDFMSTIWEVGDDKVNELNYIYNKLTFSDIVNNTIDDNISYEVFYKAFIDSLYSENRSGNFISGVITFCSMIPMRSIPYDIIAILGLNSTAFPRRVSEISFDLIQSEHRPGDRNIKETDKYLFFETLLSAKEKLYLSYIGSNIQNNSENPPSIVVDELLDYIDVKTELDARDSLVIKHPLYNFNRKYYQNKGSNYYTYLKYGNTDSTIVGNEIKEEQIILNKEISLKDIEEFYINPIKWFYNKKLNVYFDEEDILLPETEKFELNRLEQSILKKELLEIDNIDSYLNDIKKKIIDGKMPLKNIASYEVSKTYEDLTDLIHKLEDEKQGYDSKTYEIDELIGGFKISGEIENVFGNKMIMINASTDEPKAILQLQLKRWISVKADLPIEKFVLLHYDKGQIEKTELGKPSEETFNDSLNKIIQYFELGTNNVLPFIPKASYRFLKRFNNHDGIQKSYKDFKKELEAKAKYDLTIKKALDEGAFDKYENIDEEENLILNIAKLCFNDTL